MVMTSEQASPADGVKSARAVFVSSPARTDTSVIRRVLEGEGISVLESELPEPGQFIRESLIEGIRKADAVIAVLGDGRSCSNVFYELGYADALGKTVILVTQTPENIPFDLHGRRVITYEDGMHQLKEGLIDIVKSLENDSET